VLLVLPLWTLFVWVGRIRNVLDGDESKAGVIVPVVLVVLALVALVDRRRGLPLLAVATVGVWAVRVPLVLVRDHSTGFKIVHVVLALLSIGLAALSMRALSRRRALAPR
jgi:NADH:ubiquinone oxidoreductase subunit K